ncbi:hypothetical protein GURASL_27520 [Geotalea uraniireducens]|uniref:Uncharacterized protein n=1 Tax=Geotalea uraniireducens TaxID=351604 RepID=A0ABN6VUQ6_9BACT|nr:hypothetical protein [Geotalea uraniireducens]BDV43829.1 hypothetical protein GURASL_27520 [Geotalea uraniireducens]
MKVLKAFWAGFASTLVFHQGMLGILHGLGMVSAAPYSLAPTVPLHIPQVLSLAFWGGVWGIPLRLVIRSRAGMGYWQVAILFGALAPSLVAWFVVFPLKGQPVAAGGQPLLLLAGLLLNGAWGGGTAFFLRLLERSPSS